MERLNVYRCGVCGNIVTVMYVGGGTLVCCGEEMNLLEEKTADKATEKHVPVIEKADAGYRVTVGTTLHPMADEHYIQWIELQADGASYVRFLKPGDEPAAEFCVKAENVSAREHCNKHGLWKG
jgi:superoxide reductase